ncbi:hypothetical protein C8J57DRAFT_1277848 [Mycena rebaudengoi]|nr:hypothetical protein C8J57DRAFT_1277848 [Mycena rebaudengoi]
MSSPIHQVAPELWYEVFGSLSPNDLRHVNLTTSTFHHISRPLLFRHFDFHPYTSLDLAGVPPVERALERLRFWSSPEIAPLVHSCDITPFRLSSAETPYILLSEFFDRLALFTNLNSLVSKWVHFTPTGFTGLCSLPNLAHVTIELGPVQDSGNSEPIDVGSLELDVSTFTLSRTAKSVTAQNSLDHWLSALRPETLRHLAVAWNPQMFLSDDLPIYPRVETLRIEASDHGAQPESFSFLAKFPELRILSVEGPDSTHDPEPLSTELVPHLTDYTGCYHVLRSLLPTPTLRRLRLSSCCSRELLTELRLYPTPSSITSLQLNLQSFDKEFFDTVCGAFPHLTELRVDVEFSCHDGTEAIDFFKDLARSSSLPPNLEKLAIKWALEDEYYDDIPTLRELKDVLLSRHASLSKMWFDVTEYLLSWRKLPDGTVVEEEAEGSYDGVCALENTFDSFWA